MKGISLILVDFSSVLHRMVSGSLESLIHVTTAHNLTQQDIGKKLHCNYKEVGEISHIIDDNSFTFILKYGVKYEEAQLLMEYPQSVITKATKVQGIKYPLSAFIKIFDNVFFNNINNLHSRFGSTFGRMVFCLDNPTSKGYWRKRFLPTYKGTRKESRDKSSIDFKLLFEYVNNTLLPTLGQLSPMMVVEYPRAEGDDVISTLATKYKHLEKICIISEDKDLKALVDDNVIFYRPMLNRFAERLTDIEREDYIRLHSIIGDVSDNVLNATIDTKYHPDFIKWVQNKFNLVLNEYDINVLSDYITTYRPVTKSIFKDFIASKNTQIPSTNLQSTFDSIIWSDEFQEFAINHYKTSYHMIGLYSNVNDIYYEFIKEKHPKVHEQTITGDWGQVSTKVFKHYWYGEKTAKEQLVNENFETKILENPNWMKKYKLNRKLVDPFKVPKYIQKGIIQNFTVNSTNHTGDYDKLLEFFQQHEVTNGSVICDNWFPQQLKTMDW